MNDISDGAVIEALRRAMTVAAARQVTSASNLANLNTPGYRAREVKFSEALDRELTAGVKLVSTSGRHLGSEAGAEASTQEVAGLPARRDGNTVQLDRELLSMTRAAGDFARAQTALAAKFRLVRYALTEGR